MIGWAVSPRLVVYPGAVDFMQARAADIAAGRADEMIWLLEHPSLYTAGASADPKELLAAPELPVFHCGRGGKYTWHGPGQRIIYVMLRLSGRDLHEFVAALEQWMIDVLDGFGVKGERIPGRIGVWVARSGGFDKLAAIGLKLRRWVCFHGVSLNVAPDLRHYEAIIPCGNAGPQFGVTSMEQLGVAASMSDVDLALRECFDAIFGPTCDVTPPQVR